MLTTCVAKSTGNTNVNKIRVSLLLFTMVDTLVCFFKEMFEKIVWYSGELCMYFSVNILNTLYKRMAGERI